MGILNFDKKTQFQSYLTISILGRNYRLNIKYVTSGCIELKKVNTDFELAIPKKFKNKDNVEIINHAIQKLYEELAAKELDISMELVRHVTKYAPEDYQIKRLNGTFCKALKGKVLVINPDIIQYNRDIINTTLIQEFCKMKHRNGSKAYKEAIKFAMLEYDKYKIMNISNVSKAL